MLARKSQRIARRTLTEEDRWRDLEVALVDDCIEILQIKMEFHEIDVHMTYGFEIKWSAWKGEEYVEPLVTINRSALSFAVNYGAVNCVAYLMEMGARSRDPLPGCGYSEFMGFPALHQELTEVREEEAKERWVNFASTKFGLAKSVAEETFSECCFLTGHIHPGTYVYPSYTNGRDATVTTQPDSGYGPWSERLDCHDYCIATWDMYEKAEYNTLQYATHMYGRDALITRLVRGERKEIAKSYKLGFAALRYYADSQRASLLLAKNDGRLWLILTGLANVKMPPELREKIVDFAFFGKNAPERKANKEKSESE